MPPYEIFMFRISQIKTKHMNIHATCLYDLDNYCAVRLLQVFEFWMYVTTKQRFVIHFLLLFSLNYNVFFYLSVLLYL